MKWISVKERMPTKPGIVKVKIDNGEVYDGLCCRNMSGDWTIQPWDELVGYWSLKTEV